MSVSSARRGALALLVTGVLLSGCSSQEEAPEQPAPTRLADVDAGEAQVGRIGFCDLVPEETVALALADGAVEPIAEEPGERQEVGCTWTDDGRTARAWVLARPVGADLAERLVGEAVERRGCRGEEGASYGAPSVVQECRGQGSTRVRWAGLLGDTWLSCELEGPGVTRALAEPWCARLLSDLDTTAGDD